MSFFSNHSATSRFLANSASTTPTEPAARTQNSQNTAATATPRSRLPASKHFSTSVSSMNGGSQDEKLRSRSAENDTLDGLSNGATTTQVHPLRNTWVFWFRAQRSPGEKIVSYEDGIKKITASSSVESFWSLWTHLNPPSALLATTDYLLFHNGVRRPVWEDPLNLSGGKWILRLKKGVADRIWEDLILAIIGDQFDECRPTEERDASAVPGNWEDGSEGHEWPEICGCTISVRQSEDIVSLWNRTDGDQKLRDSIRDTLRRVLNLPPSIIMEYKSNNDSMQDKSSFRNSAIDRTPAS